MKAAQALLERHRERLLELIKLYGPEELIAMNVNTMQALEDVTMALKLIKQAKTEQ